MNPTIDRAVIAEAFERDEVSAWSEYGRDGAIRFRTDVESYVSRDAIELCTVPGRIGVPPIPSERYVAFADPAGGSGADSFTWAIAHAEERDGRRVVILDAVEERKPPFAPSEVVRDSAGECALYGVDAITGDKYAGDWPSEAYATEKITYLASERTKSEIYRDALPLLTSGMVELLDHPKLAAQLQGLERRTARGGRDSIDHGPGGHDDVANAAMGAILLAMTDARTERVRLWAVGDEET
jgi:hypothetical protein